MDFDIRYHLQKLPVSMFNPYVITYTSYPFDRGTLELRGAWWVRNGFIKSNNHLVVIDPRRTKRVINSDKSWLPLPLIMSLIRERGNVIDYEIPITGNLKDPKFHLHDVLVDFLENIVVKPATGSYRLAVKNTEAEIEKSLTMTWGMRKTTMLRNQEKFIHKMVHYLLDNHNASINIYPQQYALKEKEYILLFEAKKKYFLMISHKNARSFSEEDSETVDKMSVKDSLFVNYLNSLARDTTQFTIQEKCDNYVGSDLVDAKFQQLNHKREAAFLSPFQESAVDKRVKIYAGENNIPYNGFSFYRITYPGELPQALTRAYRKMNDFNNEAPRNRYKNYRKKNRL